MSMSSVINQKPLAPETIITTVLLHPKVNEKLSMSKVAKLIYDLKKLRGINTSRILCYLTASSAYCEDLDRFVSKLVSYKYATEASPIKITAEGMRICGKILAEAKLKEDQVELQKLEEAVETLLK